MPDLINFRLNGEPVSMSLDGERTLLWVLRTEFDLTGVKYGCGKGFCGACTVLVKNEAVRSCQYPFKNVKGKAVVTIEGLANEKRLHPLQEAFINHNALQCGYCTPGMILTAFSFLRVNPRPSRKQVIEGMNWNLCRCGAHTRIVDAILTAAKVM